MCTDLECRLTVKIKWQLNDMLEGYNDKIDIEDDVYLLEMVSQLKPLCSLKHLGYS